MPGITGRCRFVLLLRGSFPGVTLKDDRDGAIVDQLYLHHRTEDALLDGHSTISKRCAGSNKGVEQWLCHLRSCCLDE